MVKLSIALATYNEAANLASCLDSVATWTNEIVVVDGSSTDQTVAIAKKYGARIIVTDNPPIFHINKQKAVEACRGDWILQLDADEVVTPELVREIKSEIRNQKSEYNGYYFPRKNFFLGHWLRKGGQYPDYVIRLFRKGKGWFPQKSVHEQIVVDG
ncbi:MAG: glycosyltransferase family 2 protein, partial [Patescibacteria group bacterium]